MNKNASKFIDKIYAKVDERIDKLYGKIDQAKDRYPVDYYGLKYQDYTNALEDEIRDLQKWKNGIEHAAHTAAELDGAKAENTQLRLVLMQTADKLASCGGAEYADYIRRTYR